MFSLVWITYCLLIIYEMIEEGEAYMLLYRYVEFVQSLKAKIPLKLRRKKNCLLAEYLAGGSIYAVTISQEEVQPWNAWVKAAVFIEGSEDAIPLTGKIRYRAGIFRNFNGTLTPKDLSPKYRKIAFMYDDGSVLHVGPNEPIVDTLKRKRLELEKKMAQQQAAQQLSTGSSQHKM
jgi:hypothetical protein